MNRRTFLKDAAGAIAGGAALGGPIAAQSPSPSDSREAAEPLVTDRCGADCMVDVIKGLGLEYLCANPGSSFRALHEALVNYRGNTRPEVLTCCHEEASAARAHGLVTSDRRRL